MSSDSEEQLYSPTDWVDTPVDEKVEFGFGDEEEDFIKTEETFEHHQEEEREEKKKEDNNVSDEVTERSFIVDMRRRREILKKTKSSSLDFDGTFQREILKNPNMKEITAMCSFSLPEGVLKIQPRYWLTDIDSLAPRGRYVAIAIDSLYKRIILIHYDRGAVAHFEPGRYLKELSHHILEKCVIKEIAVCEKRLLLITIVGKYVVCYDLRTQKARKLDQTAFEPRSFYNPKWCRTLTLMGDRYICFYASSQDRLGIGCFGRFDLERNNFQFLTPTKGQFCTCAISHPKHKNEVIVSTSSKFRNVLTGIRNVAREVKFVDVERDICTEWIINIGNISRQGLDEPFWNIISLGLAVHRGREILIVGFQAGYVRVVDVKTKLLLFSYGDETIIPGSEHYMKFVLVNRDQVSKNEPSLRFYTGSLSQTFIFQISYDLPPHDYHEDISIKNEPSSAFSRPKITVSQKMVHIAVSESRVKTIIHKRKNICYRNTMVWLSRDDGNDVLKYYVTADRDGNVRVWKDMHYFERQDRVDRAKEVKWLCLNEEYDEEEEQGEEEEEEQSSFFSTVKCRWFGGEVIGLKILMMF